jgi:starvation-inducible DNA-binding protein
VRTTRASSTTSGRGSRIHPGSDGGGRRGKQGGPENGGRAGARGDAAGDSRLSMARPIVGQQAHEVQAYGQIVKLPIALSEKTCATSVDNLNQVLADTITLRDLYKKHHWQVSGHTFYQLHLLFDKHYAEQAELVDEIAERIMMLGGISLAMAADVAETTLIPRPPRGREEPPVQISRLLHAHEIILEEVRAMARQADEQGDDGTNDLLVSDVIRTNEMQVWFVSEHVVDTPLVRAK